MDSSGETVPSYQIEDELDQRTFRGGLAAAARLHEAAEIHTVT